MASVILKGVTKRYGGVTAVEDVNLEIQDHEFVVLVGPSGCGKSTTLRMIAGLEEISAGEISIGDRLVNELAPKDRDIAMVFQSYALYPHMNVYDNLAFALKLRQVPKTEIDRRVREAAKLLGIEDLLNRKPKALSGGQRQRVALGRAIVREPKVFLMDEPLSNLDAKLRVQMRAELAKLQNRLHITTIYVTHDQIEAMTMGDRIVVMKDGKVQQVGTPLHIYRHPDNMFVAGFIGTPPTNFFKVRLQKEGDQLLADFGSFRMRLPQTMVHWERYQDYAGQEVFLGLRPEYISDVEFHPESPAEYCLDAMVDVVEMMGSEAYLHASPGDHTFVARVEPKTTAKDGVPHRLCLQLDKAQLFDPATTATIR